MNASGFHLQLCKRNAHQHDSMRGGERMGGEGGGGREREGEGERDGEERGREGREGQGGERGVVKEVEVVS